MESMVERVARALCEDTLSRWRSPLGVQDEPWREFIPAARAAIEAMRDATVPMFQAGLHPPKPNEVGAIPPLNIWQAMIDAALE